MAPPWRDRYLAAGAFYLKGSAAPDNDFGETNPRCAGGLMPPIQLRPAELGRAKAMKESPDFVASLPPPPAAIATYWRPLTM